MKFKDKIANARTNSIKGSVQKINLICRMIAGKKVDEAMLQLKFCRKGAAKDVASVLNSAIANAENNHNMDIDNLFIKEIMVGKSLTLKRFHARARGKGARVLKPFTKITIFVSEKE